MQGDFFKPAMECLKANICLQEPESQLVADLDKEWEFSDIEYLLSEDLKHINLIDIEIIVLLYRCISDLRLYDDMKSVRDR